jgi:hypothetical protein
VIHDKISVVGFLILKGTFSLGSKVFLVFDETFNLAIRAVLEIFKTLGFTHFHKYFRINLV